MQESFRIALAVIQTFQKVFSQGILEPQHPPRAQVDRLDARILHDEDGRWIFVAQYLHVTSTENRRAILYEWRAVVARLTRGIT